MTRSLRREAPGWFRKAAVPLLVASLAVTHFAPQAGAQAAAPTVVERAGPLSREQRAELYQQLGVQAEFLERQSRVIKTVAKLVGPTVVFVEADVSHRAAAQHSRSRRMEEAGSGVIIELAGRHYVLSSRHVIAGVDSASIKITLADGRKIQPDRVWDDPDTDVAVMAISASDVVASPIGDSDRLEIGDFVLAVGSPFGLSNSVTFGIISAKGRRDLDLGDAGVRLQDFLQTDAAINPGNSGGPFVNLRGEVIGIITCIASLSGKNEGIGFAVPINMSMLTARQLIEQGRVARAFLGVTLDGRYGPAMAAELGLAKPVGARVSEVRENSPAAAAGILQGDVIITFGGVAVENDAHLVNMVNLTTIGKEVVLTVYRERRFLTIRAIVADRSRF